MHFLFNDVIFQVLNPEAYIAGPEFPLDLAGASRLRVSDLTRVIAEAVTECPDLPAEKPEKAKALCALIAARIDANAMLALPGHAVRFADIRMDVMLNLWAMQQRHQRLSPSLVNASVWQVSQAA